MSALEARIVRAALANASDAPAWGEGGYGSGGSGGWDGDGDAGDGAYCGDEEEEEEVVEVDEAELLALLDAAEPPLQARMRCGDEGQRGSVRVGTRADTALSGLAWHAPLRPLQVCRRLFHAQPRLDALQVLTGARATLLLLRWGTCRVHVCFGTRR
jgi:hypothetical protein